MIPTALLRIARISNEFLWIPKDSYGFLRNQEHIDNWKDDYIIASGHFNNLFCRFTHRLLLNTENSVQPQTATKGPRLGSHQADGEWTGLALNNWDVTKESFTS